MATMENQDGVVRQACPEFKRRAHKEQWKPLLPFVLSLSKDICIFRITSRKVSPEAGKIGAPRRFRRAVDYSIGGRIFPIHVLRSLRTSELISWAILYSWYSGL